MKMLGLKPTPNSGSGWIVKEDGQNEDVICQLKSTDANSIKVSKKDLDVLNYNSLVAHKVPLFAIQFLKSNEVYFVVKPQDVKDIAKLIDGAEINRKLDVSIVDIDEQNVKKVKAKNSKKVKSSEKLRKEFELENEKRFKKERKSALL